MHANGTCSAHVHGNRAKHHKGGTTSDSGSYYPQYGRTQDIKFEVILCIFSPGIDISAWNSTDCREICTMIDAYLMWHNLEVNPHDKADRFSGLVHEETHPSGSNFTCSLYEDTQRPPNLKFWPRIVLSTTDIQRRRCCAWTELNWIERLLENSSSDHEAKERRKQDTIIKE